MHGLQELLEGRLGLLCQRTTSGQAERIRPSIGREQQQGTHKEEGERVRGNERTSTGREQKRAYTVTQCTQCLHCSSGTSARVTSLSRVCSTHRLGGVHRLAGRRGGGLLLHCWGDVDLADSWQGGLGLLEGEGVREREEGEQEGGGKR